VVESIACPDDELAEKSSLKGIPSEGKLEVESATAQKIK